VIYFMTLTMNLSQADLIAALQAWVASPSGGSTGGVIHQMDAVVTPTISQGGGVTIQLNF
jgi:hypothetical protein